MNLTAVELLAEPLPVAGVVSALFDRPDLGLVGQWRVHETFQRSGLLVELLNSLADPNPLVRASAARLCGALRLTDWAGAGRSTSWSAGPPVCRFTAWPPVLRRQPPT